MSDFLKLFWNKFRILPLLVVVASLAFIIRVGEATTEFKTLSGAAFAEEKTEAAKSEEKKAETPKSEVAKSETPKEESPKTDEKKVEAEKPKTPDTEKWKDASDADLDYSEVRQDVYKDLAARRKQLDEKEADLKKREALIAATQKEISSKVKELSSLRTEIQGLLKQHTDAEQENITKLVRIYEGMKPKDAARIFNELDMDVLISVVSKMSERKTAPIIAAMNAEKARQLTLMLSEQKKLPSLAVDTSADDINAQPEAPPLPSLGEERPQTENSAPATAPPPAPAASATP